MRTGRKQELIAPVYFMGFPAMLKGWIERVFTLGFAFRLTPEAWQGDIGGRVPLLKHEKALIIQTTLFDLIGMANFSTFNEVLFSASDQYSRG